MTSGGSQRMQRCPHPRVRGAGFIAERGAECDAPCTVGVSREQVGTALRRLAQDLIAERRRAAACSRITSCGPSSSVWSARSASRSALPWTRRRQPDHDRAAGDADRVAGARDPGERPRSHRGGGAPSQPLTARIRSARVRRRRLRAAVRRASPDRVQLAADARTDPAGHVDLAGHVRPEAARAARPLLSRVARPDPDPDRTRDRGAHRGQLPAQRGVRIRGGAVG